MKLNYIITKFYFSKWPKNYFIESKHKNMPYNYHKTLENMNDQNFQFLKR